MTSKTLDQIRQTLGHVALKWEPTQWLNTGMPNLNGVLGHRDKGIAYGKITEISGWESVGKSALTMAIAALAQHDGAVVIWCDLENSFDPVWALMRKMQACPKCSGTGLVKEADCSNCGGSKSPTCGLDPEKLILIQPFVGKFGKERESRLSSAQELLSEVETCIDVLRKPKYMIVVDSIAALLTEGDSAAGLGGSYKTDMEHPKLVGRLMRRWVSLAQTSNAIIYLVNQLRSGMTKTYATGGNAIRFYAHIQGRARRVKGSRIVQRGEVIGITGLLENNKNKCGGVEKSAIGYRIMFKGPIEFVNAKIACSKEKEEEY